MGSTETEESASTVALELLDEMAAVIDECGVVFAALAEEADLNLDECARTLDEFRQHVGNAYGAASLLNSRAALSMSWSEDRSRPRAVFARHAEAVRTGAPHVVPPLPNQRFPSGYEPDRRTASEGGGRRPPCDAVARSTRKPCGNAALSIGGGEFLTNCFGHLNPEERIEYEYTQPASTLGNPCDVDFLASSGCNKHLLKGA